MQSRKRVIKDYVLPQLNCGDFLLKRVVNEIVIVYAQVNEYGQDIIAETDLYKHKKAKVWKELRMHPTFIDDWQASFVVE